MNNLSSSEVFALWGDFLEDVEKLNHFTALYLDNKFIDNGYLNLDSNEFDEFKKFYTELLDSYGGLDYDITMEDNIFSFGYKGMKGKNQYEKLTDDELEDEFSNIIRDFAMKTFFKNQVKEIKIITSEDLNDPNGEMVSYRKGDGLFPDDQKNNINFYDILRLTICLASNSRSSIRVYEFKSYDRDEKNLILYTEINNFSS